MQDESREMYCYQVCRTKRRQWSLVNGCQGTRSRTIWELGGVRRRRLPQIENRFASSRSEQPPLERETERVNECVVCWLEPGEEKGRRRRM